MIRQNLHTHTIYCDGKNTPTEMAQAALDAGLTSLGFSGHSPMPWDNDWGMTEDKLPLYRAAVAEAKNAFAGRLSIYCGVEWDSLSAPEFGGFDFVIGSVHNIDLSLPGEPPSVDNTPEATADALARYFGGDADAMAEAYFTGYDTIAHTTAVDIVGHFDLLTKFDEKAGFFDENTPRFRDAAMAAMESLLRADKIFEVNTGAMSRGWRTSPYPSPRLLRELKARNARMLVSSDSHSADTIAHAFPESEALLTSVGFTEIWELTDAGFRPRAL